MEILSTQFLLALGSIILLDLVLAGDNAVVIAMASRKLPEKATVSDQDRGEEDSSKTTADISGIAMKGQPTE